MLTKYINLRDVTGLQTEIMIFVDWWVRSEKRPVPRREIINAMKKSGTKTFTTIFALNSLMKKGYLRRAIIISNQTFYVQLRRITN